MNKFFFVIVIAIIVVGGYFIFKKSPEQTPQESVSPLSVEKASVASTAEEKVITYTDAGYSPSPLDINNRRYRYFQKRKFAVNVARFGDAPQP